MHLPLPRAWNDRFAWLRRCLFHDSLRAWVRAIFEPVPVPPLRYRRLVCEKLESLNMLTSITVSPMEPSYSEGDTAYFLVDVQDIDQPFSVDFEFSGGPAGPSSGSLSFSPSSTSVIVGVPTADNATPGDGYELTLALTSSSGTGSSGPTGPLASASVSILDNDGGSGPSGPTGPTGGDPPELNLGIGAPWEEGSGMYFSVSFSHTTDQVVSFTVEVRDASGALASADWHVATTTVWVAANEYGYYSMWIPIDDLLIEGPEDFTFTISNPVNAVLGAVTSQVMTLEDNDLPSTVDIDVAPLDEILANAQVDEAEGFRVTGLVFDPSPTLSEVLLQMDLNFDGDTQDDGEEVPAALTPHWVANYWTFSVDVTPVPDDGFSSLWGNETPSDTLTVTALLTDADSNQVVSAGVDFEVFNVAPQLSDPLITYELDSQGYVVSASITGTFDDPGIRDYHQLAVTWAVDAGFSGQEPMLLPLGERSYSITRLFESSSETEVEDLYPIVIDVMDDDSGADAFVAVGNRERYSLTYTIEGNADEDGEQPAVLRLMLDRPAPAGGITVSWQPLLLPGEDPTSKDIASASDFHNASGTWTFPQGQQEKAIELKPIDDEVVEKNERMKINMPWVTTEDYVVTTTGTGHLGFWSTVKILDDEWRFVNPGSDHFEIHADGSWHPILEHVIDVDKWIWYAFLPIGRFTGHASTGYVGFDGVQALSEATMIYGGNTGVDSAFRESQMEFSVHSQTGDIVRNDGAPLSGDSVDDSVAADIGYSWLISNFGPNEKRVSVTYELALGYDVEISATGNPAVDAITLAFTGGGDDHRYGVHERQLSLIARNRVSDDNTGLEWQD